MFDTERRELSADHVARVQDLAQQVLLYNEAYAGLIGASHPWAIGHRANEVFAQSSGVTPDPVAIGEVRRTAEPFTEVRKPPPGEPDLPPAAYRTHSYSAVRDSHGHMVAVLAVVIDAANPSPARQFHDLRELTAAFAHTVTLDDVARVTMRHALLAFDVDHVALAVAEGHDWRAVRRARGDTMDEVDLRLPPLWHRFPSESPLPIIRAAATGHPVFITDREQADFRPDAADRYDRSLRALAAIPLPAGRIRGAMVFAYQRPHRWTPDQRALLSAAVELIGRQSRVPICTNPARHLPPPPTRRRHRAPRP